jgi:phosphoglucomutase/phosphomannomutase
LLTPQIRDKDAAGAALMLAELALDQKRQGRTVLAYLAQIERQFGYFRNEMRTLVMPGVEGKTAMARMLDRLRRSPPARIGAWDLTRLEDLLDEEGRLGPLKGDTDRASRNFLIFHLGDSARIALRPSGTEPKAKTYIELSSPPCATGVSGAEWSRRCRQLDAAAKELGDAFITMCKG